MNEFKDFINSAPTCRLIYNPNPIFYTDEIGAVYTDWDTIYKKEWIDKYTNKKSIDKLNATLNQCFEKFNEYILTLTDNDRSTTIKNITQDIILTYNTIQQSIDAETDNKKIDVRGYLHNSILYLLQLFVSNTDRIGIKYPSEFLENMKFDIFHTLFEGCEGAEPIKIKTNTEKESESDNEPTAEKKANKEFTTARQTMAIVELLRKLGVTAENTDKTQIARFIQFITGKETGSKTIKNTNIYKNLSGTGKTNKGYDKDCSFVATYFRSIGLLDLADELDKQK